MKRQERIEHYSFARAEWIDKLRQSTESWDYGRKHALPIWPEFVSKGYFHETMFYAHHRPTNTAFELPLTGELLVEHGDRKITVHPGELYILPAGEPNTLRAGNATPCWKMSAGFCGQLVSPLLATLGLQGERNLIRLTTPQRIYDLLEKMFQLIRNRESVPELAGLTLQLFTDISQQTIKQPPPQLADAARIFEFNLSGPITLREVAMELKLTEAQLIRLFRKHYHTTPMQFLRELRMQKAAALLRGSAMPIGEIAQTCGYLLERNFCREFQKKFGKSPRNYRKQ